MPWWEKIKTASFADGKFELGALTVSHVSECFISILHCGRYVQSWEIVLL